MAKDKQRFPYGVTQFGITKSGESCSRCYRKDVPLADLQSDVDDIRTLCIACAQEDGWLTNLRKGIAVQWSVVLVKNGCSDQELQGKVVVVTGHRPFKLGGYEDETFSQLVLLAEHCLGRLKPKMVLTGMALGWDQAIAVACVKMEIPFTACIPGEWQPNKWVNWEDRKRWSFLCSKAHEVVNTDPNNMGYAAWKLQHRNKYMVDRGEVLLSLYDGGGGGTKNCRDYAKKKNLKILNCWDRWVRKDF